MIRLTRFVKGDFFRRAFSQHGVVRPSDKLQCLLSGFLASAKRQLPHKRGKDPQITADSPEWRLPVPPTEPLLARF